MAVRFIVSRFSELVGGGRFADNGALKLGVSVKTAIRAACLAALLTAPTTALAAEVTYYFSGSFTAPATGSYSGSYVYDTVFQRVRRIEAKVTPGYALDGATVLPGGTYSSVGVQTNEVLHFSSSMPATGLRGGYIEMSPSLAAPTVVVRFGDTMCTSSDCGSLSAEDTERRYGLGTVTLTPPATVPTLSEWGMILFGLALAGAAALHLSRRRLAA